MEWFLFCLIIGEQAYAPVYSYHSIAHGRRRLP